MAKATIDDYIAYAMIALTVLGLISAIVGGLYSPKCIRYGLVGKVVVCEAYESH